MGGIAAATALIAGTALSLYVIYGRYDRVVVAHQWTGPTVRISSIRFTEPGFVVLYERGKVGLEFAGATVYLKPGYYRNIVVPINFDFIVDRIGAEFIARVYRDNGDTILSESDDTPLTDQNGKLYEKRFTFWHPENPVGEIYMELQDRPWQTITDAVFP